MPSETWNGFKTTVLVSLAAVGRAVAADGWAKDDGAEVSATHKTATAVGRGIVFIVGSGSSPLGVGAGTTPGTRGLR